SPGRAAAHRIRVGLDRNSGGCRDMSVRLPKRGLVMAIVIGLLALTSSPSPAGAHAFLISSTPASGASVKSSPQALRLVFSEDVVPRYARVFVIGAAGQDLGGHPAVAGSVVTVPLRRGQRGSY